MVTSQIQRTIKEYARGLAGGLIFGLPMLYTQEFWQQGFIISPVRLIFFLFSQYLLLLGYVHYAGFRREKTIGGVAFEAVEALGLAFFISTTVLLALSQLKLEMSLEEILGKVIIGSLPVSIGVAVATVQLGERTKKEERELERETKPGSFGQFVVAAAGAVFLAINFAATQEITIISIEAGILNMLLLVLLSLFITYAMVFYSNFRGHHRKRSYEYILETPLGETIASYALALVISGVILFLVGTISIEDSLITMIYQMITLALPASLGAAAGRLLV